MKKSFKNWKIIRLPYEEESIKFEITLELDDIHSIERILNRHKMELMRTRYDLKHSEFPNQSVIDSLYHQTQGINRITYELYQFTRRNKNGGN